MGENKSTFIFMDISLLVVIIGLTYLIFNLHGKFFAAEFMLLLILIFFSFIAMVGAYSNSRWGWAFLSFVFALTLIDLAFMYHKNVPTGKVFLAALIVTSISFVVSVLGIKKHKCKKTKSKGAQETYVASSTGKKYHKESCDWAKKIKADRKITLTEAEAKEKGLKACECVGG